MFIQRGREATHANQEEGISREEEEQLLLLGMKSCIPCYSRGREATLATWEEEVYLLLFKREREATIAIGRAVSLVIQERKRSISCYRESVFPCYSIEEEKEVLLRKRCISYFSREEEKHLY